VLCLGKGGGGGGWGWLRLSFALLQIATCIFYVCTYICIYIQNPIFTILRGCIGGQYIFMREFMVYFCYIVSVVGGEGGLFIDGHDSLAQYICMYIYVHTCMYTHKYMHMYVYIHVCTNMYVYIHVCTYMYVYVHVCTCVFVRECVYIYIHTYIFTFVFVPDFARWRRT